MSDSSENSGFSSFLGTAGKTAGTVLKHGFNVASTAWDIKTTGDSIRSDTATLAGMSRDLGWDTKLFARNSTLIEQMQAELGERQGNVALKSGAGNVVSTAAGALGGAMLGPIGMIGFGLGSSFLSTPLIDDISNKIRGFDPALLSSYQGLQAAYDKVGALQAADIGAIVVSQLSEKERKTLKSVMDSKEAKDNPQLVVDALNNTDTVRTKAAEILGSNYNPKLPALEQLAQFFNTGEYPPAILAADNDHERTQKAMLNYRNAVESGTASAFLDDPARLAKYQQNLQSQGQNPLEAMGYDDSVSGQLPSPQLPGMASGGRKPPGKVSSLA